MTGRKESIRYKRNHFSTRLPQDYLYSPTHYWLAQDGEEGVWKVGLTGFATRMLGEIVEFEFEKKPGTPASAGEVLGWIEGFKAVSDIFCVAEGEFQGSNSKAAEDCEIICKSSYDEGWLYKVRGQPDERVTAVDEYIKHLDQAIDRMLDEPWKNAALDTSGDTKPGGEALPGGSILDGDDSGLGPDDGKESS
ncbi:MAG: glycine cleavage system protein H [Planctomycetota bacterium]